MSLIRTCALGSFALLFLHKLALRRGFFRLPQLCPAVAGLPLHVVLDDREERTSRSLAVLDLRRV